MPDAGGLQLLPSQKKHISIRGLFGHSVIFVVGIVLVIVMGIAYTILKVETSNTMSDIADVDLQIQAIYKKRDKKSEDTITALVKQLSTTESLLTTHKYWSQGLLVLQGMIEPRVRLTTLAADSVLHTYTFQAQADSFATVAQQVAAFYANDAVTDLKLTKVGTGGAGLVDFGIQLTVKPETFVAPKTP